MSQQGGKDEGMLLIVLGLAVLAGLGWLMWHLFSVQIMDAMRWLRWAELQIIILVFGDGYTHQDWILGQEFVVKPIKEWASSVDSADLTPQHIGLLTRTALTPLKWFFSFGLIAMAVLMIFKGPGTMFHTRHTIDSLIDVQSRTFKAIRPFAKFNPQKQPFRAPGTPVPAELPVFAEALSPEEWVAYHAIPMPDGIMDEAVALKAFKQQLGPRWRGFQDLPIHCRALMAGFALKAARKRDEGDALLNDIGASWSHEKGLQLSRRLISKIDSILKDPKISKEIYMKASAHAYRTPAMLKALNVARENAGVLAPAQFVWLRGVDRDLWYPLNNLGRKSFHAEAMGAMAHYSAERLMGMPIPVPQVEDAVKALKSYLAANPVAIPALDYSQSKNKRGIAKPLSS